MSSPMTMYLDTVGWVKSLQAYRPLYAVRVVTARWLEVVRRICTCMSLLLLVLITASRAQVSTMIIPDKSMSTSVISNGSVHEIRGGSRPEAGVNLFHSFDRFDVGMGHTAHFVGAPGIDNIIGRVTGPEASRIDGTLQAGASLFLLNPQGILFGPSARLDINGSFHASTADVLRFADGSAFSTRFSEKSTLTVALPSAFGFLHENPAGIAIQGSEIAAPVGETLSIVGGNIDITGGVVRAPSGQINLASVSSTGDAMIDLSNPSRGVDVESFDRRGKITLSQGARLDTSGHVSGVINIRGGRLHGDEALLLAVTLGNDDSDGIGVDIDIAKDIVLGSGTGITTLSLGAGKAKDIKIVADSIDMGTDTLIGTASMSDGDAGNLMVEVGTFTLTDSALVDSTAFGTGQAGALTVSALGTVTVRGVDSKLSADGHAGSVVVKASALELRDRAQLTAVNDRGMAGRINLQVEQLVLSENSQINASGSGAGTVSIRGNSVKVDNSLVVADTLGDFDGAETGIDIAVRSLQVLGGSQIDSSTLGTGQAGGVTIVATGDVALIGHNSSGLKSRLTSVTAGDGNTGGVSVMTPTLTIDGGLITTVSFDQGNAGDITLKAGTMTLTGNARIDSSAQGVGQGGSIKITATDAMNITGDILDFAISSNTSSSGHAGSISIDTPMLAVSGPAIISSSTARTAQGNAGDITINAESLILSGGAQITSSTLGSGRGGAISVTATDSIAIFGRHEQAPPELRGSSGITSFAIDAQGHAGRVSITAPALSIADNGLVSTSTSGDGNGGEIIVEVGTLTLASGAAIDSNTFGSGAGGNVTVNVTGAVMISGGIPTGLASNALLGDGDAGSIRLSADSVDMRGEGTIEARTFTAGNAGAIELDVGFLSLTEGATIASSTTPDSKGTGGDIIIKARMVTLSDQSVISAQSTGSGNAGTIRLTAVNTSLYTNSSITTNAARASGGNLTLESQTIRISDSKITATVGSGKGRGGNITIGGVVSENGAVTERVETITLERSQIRANTDAGDGANIVIGAQQVLLDNNSEIAANTNSGVGGNITIAGTVPMHAQALSRSETVILLDSDLTAKAQEGQGGRIDIVAKAFLADPDSVIDASSQDGGIDGEVNIEAVVTNLSELVMPLSQRLAPETPLLRNHCAARLHQGLISSFVERERAGIPSAPDGLLPSRLDVDSAEMVSSIGSLPNNVAMSSDTSWRLRSRCP